ncbi:magnesium transporter NIPA-domain-containing protein [Staphylotrichum tortipilum]|uniref:Magnesium transporter NIPA-domain-containing protein n=1 Tax=Staphylotrichum tortipilum TaxID=2831512 RepID=A0AAN6MBC5_9PEZI|nr:magnesium transporter NIPA-domain-containing protein [Staphylotrichum longicolle]
MRLPPTPALASPPARALPRAWPWLSGGGDPDSPEDELQNWSSLIGIITAICGNILIALALNVQRYAHLRLHRRKVQARELARQALKNAAAQGHGQGARGTAGQYGAAGGTNGTPAEARYRDDEHAAEDAEDADGHDHHPRASSETDPLAQSFRSDVTEDDVKAAVASTYLKDPYWWLGQVLITVGESGNFLAYGFAPASIVSPLGVVALVSNCVIAPLVFGEVFRQRDFWGVIIAVGGAVTVVLSAQTQETKLGPHEVWDAITTIEFEIYMAVSCGLIALLMWLSPRYGSRTILVDLGLVGLFGGYTALATKGVSSMLSSTLLGAFTTPVTYALLFVLLFTAVMQVRYVNKALQRFDSTQVIPIQFVLFTLSVIIGSAVLYRDFERTSAEQAAKFVGGCSLTFFGVFLITSGRPRQDDDDEATLSDVEGIEETIGLRDQDRVPPPTPPQPRTRAHATPVRPRGSSRTSRVSFSDALHTPLSVAGIPSVRRPPQRSLLDDDIDAHFFDEDAPLLGNLPGSDEPAVQPLFLNLHAVTSEPSIPAIPAIALPSEDPINPLTTTASTPVPTTTKLILGPPLLTSTPPRSSGLALTAQDRPTTPRPPSSAAAAAAAVGATRLPPAHVHYSPSPFASTLSAVVGDKLLAHIDGEGYGSPTKGGRRARAGTASRGIGRALFVPPGLAADGSGDGERYRDEPPAQPPLVDVQGEEGGRGLRGRARSLSLTLGLGGLWGGGKGNHAGDGDGSGDGEGQGEGDGEGWGGGMFGALLARARTAGEERRGSGSGV